jgi:hypothetical protein
MKLIDYINKCVDNYVEMTPGGDRNLRILVDCSKKIGYGFVQIGGAVYIPNSKYSTFDGIFMRSSDLVDGWEEFDDTGLEIPFVKEIAVKRKARVGLFFYVNEELLPDLIDIGHAELLGDCKICKSSHYEVWNEKYDKIYNKPYDYYLRGRVVYKYKENKYILYADKCIEEKGIKKIIDTFGLETENVEIERTDSHYVCKNCNIDYL